MQESRTLEAALEFSKQPWEIQHDFPGSLAAQADAAARAKLAKHLDELQREAIVEHLSENVTGPDWIGSIILLIEYLVAKVFVCHQSI